MINSNIYFRGFVFNQQNITDLETTFDFIDNISPYFDINKIISYHNYTSFYFETSIIDDSNIAEAYKNLLFDTSGKIHKDFYVNHFFDIDDNNIDNHSCLYKYISNLENLSRLFIALGYFLSPNIDFDKKNNDIIFADDISKYTSVFFKDTKNNLMDDLKLSILIQEYEKDPYNAKNNIFNKIDKIHNDYYIIQKIKCILNNINTEVKNIRGMIAHNNLFLGYQTNLSAYNFIDYQSHINYIKTIYNNINNEFINTLTKYNFIYTTKCFYNEIERG